LEANGVTYEKSSIYQDFRAGDVRHSQADISKAKNLLGFEPEFNIQKGIDKAIPWYIGFLTK
jgi:UDP-N-acetylglucosamine 4-epimerase